MLMPWGTNSKGLCNRFHCNYLIKGLFELTESLSRGEGVENQPRRDCSWNSSSPGTSGQQPGAKLVSPGLIRPGGLSALSASAPAMVLKGAARGAKLGG